MQKNTREFHKQLNISRCDCASFYAELSASFYAELIASFYAELTASFYGELK